MTDDMQQTSHIYPCPTFTVHAAPRKRRRLWLQTYLRFEWLDQRSKTFELCIGYHWNLMLPDLHREVRDVNPGSTWLVLQPIRLIDDLAHLNISKISGAH
jgi:hypothetical protein